MIILCGSSLELEFVSGQDSTYEVHRIYFEKLNGDLKV
jgi:hypothetical protein